jgi:hypothetical protein
MADEPLSVSALFSFIGDALSPVLDMLRGLGWDVGDWTFFLPIALPAIYWIVLKVSKRSPYNRPYFKLAFLGLVLGGILEHFQKPLERCLADGITSCF